MIVLAISEMFFIFIGSVNIWSAFLVMVLYDELQIYSVS